MDFYNKRNFEQLSAEFAHEVKNPVALIKANIDYMQMCDTKGLYEKNYGIIKKELQKITNIVMDFIKTARPTETSEKEIIFIYDLVSEVIEEFNTPQTGKEISFELNCLDEDLKIFGEYSKICIVFFNIYKNAIEAISSKGIISTLIKKDSGEIIIKIVDNGEGINESVEKEIGTPFFTTKPNGSGLGLSICKKIIESHGGTFSICNNRKKGCTVQIKLKEYIETNK